MLNQNWFKLIEADNSLRKGCHIRIILTLVFIACTTLANAASCGKVNATNIVDACTTEAFGECLLAETADLPAEYIVSQWDAMVGAFYRKPPRLAETEVAKKLAEIKALAPKNAYVKVGIASQDKSCAALEVLFISIEVNGKPLKGGQFIVQPTYD